MFPETDSLQPHIIMGLPLSSENYVPPTQFSANVDSLNMSPILIGDMMSDYR